MAYETWLNHYKRARETRTPVEFEKRSQYDPSHWYQGIKKMFPVWGEKKL